MEGLFTNSDNLLKLRGVKDPAGNLINNAVVTYQLLNSASQEVESGSLSSVDVLGDYTAILTYRVMLGDPDYTIIATAVAGGITTVFTLVVPVLDDLPDLGCQISDFRTLVQNNVNDVFLNLNEFACQVTYIPYEGFPRTLSAVIEYNESTQATFGSDGLRQDEIITLYTASGANWNPQDIFTVGAKSYKLFGAPYDDGFGYVQLSLKYVHVFEHSIERYRLGR